MVEYFGKNNIEIVDIECESRHISTGRKVEFIDGLGSLCLQDRFDH